MNDWPAPDEFAQRTIAQPNVRWVSAANPRGWGGVSPSQPRQRPTRDGARQSIGSRCAEVRRLPPSQAHSTNAAHHSNQICPNGETSHLRSSSPRTTPSAAVGERPRVLFAITIAPFPEP